MSGSTHLTPEELRTIFREQIAPDLFAGRGREEQPFAILLGGQPGAGKSQAIARLQRRHRIMRAVAIIGDDFRSAHPAYLDVLRLDPLAMPEVTATAAATWVRMSIDHAREHRVSVVVEGTFRDPDTTLSTARAFSQAGFEVHVAALAVPAEVSRLDTLHRYFYDIHRGAAARWTSPQAHDAGYVGAPRLLALAESCPFIGRLSVLNRADDRLYENVRGELGRWKGPLGAAVALDVGRMEPPQSHEARAWLDRLHEDLAWALEADRLNSTTGPVFAQLLIQDAPRVLAYAWPTASGVDIDGALDAVRCSEQMLEDLHELHRWYRENVVTVVGDLREALTGTAGRLLSP